MIHEVQCELDGGLIVADREKLHGGDWNLLEEFTVALDVQGKSDVVYDFPGEDWKTVWRRETSGLVDRCNRGELATLILHEGAFFVHVDVGGREPVEDPAGGAEFRCGISVPSGQLVIAEVGKLAESWGLRERYDHFFYKRFPVPAGDYLVRFIVIGDQKRHRKDRRVFGGPNRPAIYMQVVPGKEKPGPLTELPHYSFL